jgi:hypothetical protein
MYAAIRDQMSKTPPHQDEEKPKARILSIKTRRHIVDLRELAPIRLADFSPDLQAQVLRELGAEGYKGEYLPFTLDELKASIAQDEQEGHSEDEVNPSMTQSNSQDADPRTVYAWALEQLKLDKVPHVVLWSLPPQSEVYLNPAPPIEHERLWLRREGYDLNAQPDREEKVREWGESVRRAAAG